MLWPPFVGPAYTAQSQKIECEQLKNLYLEPVESGAGQLPMGYVNRPGLTTFGSGFVGPIRALFAQDGRVFFVGGHYFYELAIGGTATRYGPIAIDGGLATIVSNGDGGHQLAIASGGSGYIFDLVANTLTQITAASFPAPCSTITFLDGYFIALTRNTNQIGFSALFNGLSWSGLDVAQRESGSDRLSTIIADHQQLWLMGSQTGEAWRNVGTASFPFQRQDGSFFEGGVIGATVQKFDNTIAWLSQGSRGGGLVYRMEGYTPKRISTFGVEAALASYSTYLDAEAFTEEWLGHTFYVLNFPTANKTWVYDAALPPGLGWHERDWYNSATGLYEVARPRVHCFGFDRHLVGDRELGTIYTESSTTYQDNGVDIHKRRRAPHLVREKHRQFYHHLEVDLEVGTGIVGSTTEAKAVLRYSNDGANTWPGVRQVGLGLVGQYDTRVRFPALGSAVDRVFELVITDPVRVAIAAAYLDVTPGAH